LILKKALSLVAAIAAMAAAAAVCVVAAAFALYALLRYYVGPAGAAAAIAVLAAVVAVVLALVAYGKVRPKRVKDEDQPLSTRLIELAREKPIVAAGAAVAAGLVLLRNPGVVGAVVSAAMANRARDAERRDRHDRRR
jgi:hypothetical protein